MPANTKNTAAIANNGINPNKTPTSSEAAAAKRKNTVVGHIIFIFANIIGESKACANSADRRGSRGQCCMRPIRGA